MLTQHWDTEDTKPLTMNSPPEPTTHIDDHTLIQQALFLCSHDKVVRVVPVIDDVFQINPCTKDKWSITMTVQSV